MSDLWIHSATSTEARNRGGAILGKIQGGPSCLMAWAPINCMGGQQVFKNFILAEMLLTWTEGIIAEAK